MPGPCHTMPEPWHHMLDLCHDMPEPCHGLPNIFPLLDKICTVQLGPCRAESQLYVPSTTWLWEHCALSGVQRVMLGPLPDFSDTTLAPMPGDAIWVLSHIFNNIMLAPPYCSCKVMLVPPPSFRDSMQASQPYFDDFVQAPRCPQKPSQWWVKSWPQVRVPTIWLHRKLERLPWMSWALKGTFSTHLVSFKFLNNVQ